MYLIQVAHPQPEVRTLTMISHYLTDRARIRHYLIPKGEPLPLGEDELYTLTHERHLVDAEALSAWEISTDEALAWRRQQYRAAADQVANAANGFFQALQTVLVPTPRAELTMQAVAALMGETVYALRTDPEARWRGWQRLIDHGALIAKAMQSDDTEQHATAQNTWEWIGETLQTHGVLTDPEWETFLGRLYEARNDNYQT